MKSEQIRAVLLKLQAYKDAIDEQVKIAKRKAMADGVWADPDWLRRAEHAARMAGRRIQKVQAELGIALKEERKPQQDSFERAFIKKAREILPRPLYEQILSETLTEVQVA